MIIFWYDSVGFNRNDMMNHYMADHGMSGKEAEEQSVKDVDRREEMRNA